MQRLMDVNSLLQNTKMELTSNVCDSELHTKSIQMMMVEGKEVCPICELENENRELARIEKEKYDKFLNRKNYRYLEEKSVIKDRDLWKASFGNFEAVEPEEIANKERALIAFKQYKLGEIFTTWFTGTPGAGKSHLGMGILRNLNESGQKDKKCVFIDFDEMLRLIRDSYGDKHSKFTENYFINLCSEADYLVLDDLGAEIGSIAEEIQKQKKASDFIVRILNAIGQARQDRPTIITTNLSRDLLEWVYEKRTTSRLFKNTYLINFSETMDKRKKTIEF